jgi:hypothetical protein
MPGGNNLLLGSGQWTEARSRAVEMLWISSPAPGICFVWVPVKNSGGIGALGPVE